METTLSKLFQTDSPTKQDPGLYMYLHTHAYTCTGTHYKFRWSSVLRSSPIPPVTDTQRAKNYYSREGSDPGDERRGNPSSRREG